MLLRRFGSLAPAAIAHLLVVVFERCKVNPNHGKATGGKGGEGGSAEARGGAGEDGVQGHVGGYPGGGATAEGGKGGPEGRKPAIPRTDLKIDRGDTRGCGKGGKAEAKAGGGGAGIQGGRAGGSEASNAQGGAGGDNKPGQKQSDPNG